MVSGTVGNTEFQGQARRNLVVTRNFAPSGLSQWRFGAGLEFESELELSTQPSDWSS